MKMCSNHSLSWNHITGVRLNNLNVLIFINILRWLLFEILVLNFYNVVVYKLLLLYFLMVPVDITHSELRILQIVLSVVQVHGLRNFSFFEIQECLHVIANIRILTDLLFYQIVLKENRVLLIVNWYIILFVPIEIYLLRLSHAFVGLVLHINRFLELMLLWLFRHLIYLFRYI